MSTSTRDRSSTRDRIVDEAVRLFSEHGYSGTTITKIESAVGLTPGAGGLYRHFKTKDEILAAGVERQLGRLEALRDIRRLLTPLDDLAAELTVTARVILAELDNESDLLRILASEARARPELLTEATKRLVSSTFEEFAGWIAERADPTLSGETATRIATVGIGSLFASRLMRDVLGTPQEIGDEELVRTWVMMMIATLEAATKQS
jgi:AcrR family transcriptional regulator